MSTTMIVLATALAFIFLVMQTKKQKTNLFKTAFECGFNSKNKSTNSFSVNYFYFTIIFLVFDLEIMFILPMLMFNMSANQIIMGVLFVSFFMLLLILEWLNNFLEWFKL